LKHGQLLFDLVRTLLGREGGREGEGKVGRKGGREGEKKEGRDGGREGGCQIDLALSLYSQGFRPSFPPFLLPSLPLFLPLLLKNFFEADLRLHLVPPPSLPPSLPSSPTFCIKACPDR